MSSKSCSFIGLDLCVVVILVLLQSNQVTGSVSSSSMSGRSWVDENHNAAYECKASCTNGTCVFKWPTVSGLTFIKNGKYLNVTNVQRKSGGGKYAIKCIVEDRDKVPLLSNTILLDVYYGPDSVTISQGSSLTIQENKTYGTAVTCTSSTCHPACSKTEWIKGGSVFKPTETLFSSSDVAIRSRAGSYVCKVTNTQKATPTSKTGNFDLIIEYPPVATASWNRDTKTLTCHAVGVPASYTFGKWVHYFNNVKIRELSSTRNYTFKTLSYQDRGNYSCKADNGIPKKGTWKSSAGQSIEPSDGPMFVTYSYTYNVSKAASLPIEFYIYAFPSIARSDVRVLDNSSEPISGGNVEIFVTSYQVYVDFYSKPVRPVGQYVKVTLNPVLENYFGNLHISLTNGHGTAARDFTIYPEGPPDPPIDLQITPTSHDTVTLTFRSGFFNGASQTFVVEYQSQAGSQWVNGSSVLAGTEKNITLSTTIGGLDPETFYTFRCYGYNIYDKGDYADNVTVTTLEAPVPWGAIIGGSVGGILGVALVIIFVIVICRLRGRKGDNRQNSMYGASPPVEGEKSKMETSPVDSGRENPVCMTDEPNYENTTLNNGGLTPSFQNNGDWTAKVKEEPIYSNQRKDSGQIKEQDGEDLVAMAGYIDLENGNPAQVEEAYMKKGRPLGPARKPEESAYLNMDELKTSTTPHQPMYPADTSPQYLNVAEQIGLIGKGANSDGKDTDVGNNIDKTDSQESLYLDMDVVQTPKLCAKTNVHGASGVGEGTYVAMNTKKGPSVATKPKLKITPKGGNKYQNISLREASSGKGKVTFDQDPYTSMSTNSRNSVPSYHAPPPPPSGLPSTEEVYENTSLR